MKQVLLFFGLIVLLSLPFWLMGFLLPTHSLLFGLPISALMAVCPFLAAAILTYHSGRGLAVKRLLFRTFDISRIKDKKWLLVAIFTMPIVMFMAWLLMKLLGWPLPEFVTFAWTSLPIMILFYFVGAVGEELGWMGYAIDRLQARLGFLKAAIILGLVWELWHVIPFLAQGRSWLWIVAQCLAGIAMRIIMVWLYNKSNNSLFVVVIFHTFINVSFSLFPNGGSCYNPFAVAAVLIVLLAGLFLWRSSRKLVSVVN